MYQIHGPRPLDSAPHTFLNWIKLILRKWLLLVKIIVAVSCFSKRSIVDIWQSSGYVSGSEYPTILNMSLVLNVPVFLDILRFWICLWFSICQDSEFTRVLNMRGYTEFRMCLNNSWICLNMSVCVWMWWNTHWLCLKLPEWLLFYISPFLHFLLEYVVSYLRWSLGLRKLRSSKKVEIL